jgi:hypothetical protein
MGGQNERAPLPTIKSMKRSATLDIDDHVRGAQLRVFRLELCMTKWTSKIVAGLHAGQVQDLPVV